MSRGFGGRGLSLLSTAGAMLLLGNCGSESSTSQPVVLEEGEIPVDDICDVDDTTQNCIEVADGVVTLDDLPGLHTVNRSS